MTWLTAWFQGGPWEVLIVLFVILLLFGANRLPGLARSLGKSLNEFKKGKQEGDSAEDGDKPAVSTSDDSETRNGKT